MSGSLSHHLKRDEEILKTAVRSVLCSSGALLIWIVLLIGLALCIAVLEH